jgi:predicted phosphodiesterase
MFRETETVRLGGHAIHILHDINDLSFDPAARGIDIVVSGHSHKPLIERRGDVLYLNPGSAGPRRFNLPITLATLELTANGPEARLHHLAGGG